MRRIRRALGAVLPVERDDEFHLGLVVSMFVVES